MNMQATNSMPVSTLGFLDGCHDIVLKHLRPQLKKMFESSDLAFIEFAEKAQSNTSQLCFFEAMTVIQKNRDNVEDLFYRELGRSFADFGCAGHQATSTELTEDDALTLLSKEDTDIQVAIQNMVAGASAGSAQELFAMRQRLAVLNHGIQMEEKDIPGGPTALANAFHQAVSELVLEHQTLLIVYLLFNKFVLSKTTTLYDDYNKHLLEAGLLPNLKYQVRVNPSKAQAQSQTEVAEEEQGQEQGQGQGQVQGQGPGQVQGHPGSATGANTYTDRGADGNSNQTLGDELFGDIMQLLSRRSNPAQVNTAGNTGQQGSASSNPGQANAGGNTAQQGPSSTSPIPQTKIVTALHQLQQVGTTGNPVVTGTTGIVNTVEENNQLVATLVENLSAEREQLYEDIDQYSLATADTQVIDLVGMMFEFIVKDDEIPSVAKVELSRLHTPYLKVAILDKEFFTDYNHPAHELLNTLARAAARWVFENSLDRGIFPAIHNVVERIVADFERNIDLFSNLLELFRANVRDMENKSSAIEKRTQQAAEGKEKLELARNYAADAISKCLKGHIIPDPIRKLLNEVWQEKLMFIYLREPESSKSDSWKLAIQTIKAIIWSVEPRTTAAAQTTLRERLPEVQKQIEMAGETLHAYGNNDNESQLALIKDIQAAILSASVGECRLPEQACKPATLDFRAPEAVPEDTNNAESSSKSKDEDLSPEVAAAMVELQDVAFGTWFLIQKDEGSLPERLKLSWYSNMSGNYMFVDCMGMKTGVRKHEELATLMVSGKARVLKTEQHPIIRRALEAIRRLLGSEKKAPE
jgi:hypothetical protein